MRHLQVISDPTYTEKKFNGFERFLLRFIRDKRDLPFFFLCLQIACTILPVAVALFCTTGAVWWTLVAVFLVLEVYFMGPFILMLHNTSHNVFFKPEYKWGNRLIPWALCPFMGQTPDTYFSHHIGMHHAENNLAADRSSTMGYQRDRLADFMRYFGRFLFVGIFDLINYLRTRQKRRFLKRAILGEIAFFALCFLLAWFNWQATLFVFILPLIIVRFLMMSGNWAQHAFIDPTAPENSYVNSITCINSSYNKRCFNDGYHIGHHLRPHLHWTEMPNDFLANKDKYAEQKALVFEGVDYHQIWALLMVKRYDRLAEHVVNLNGMYRSQQELISVLKQRTKRV